MKKIIIVSSLIWTLFILWCWRPETAEVASAPEKNPFYVETVSISDVSWWSSIKKTWKVIGSQDIVVSSQASWRVSSLWAGIWDNVAKNTRVVTLSDSSWIYTFSAQRANAAVKQAKLNYEQTVVSLDKSILDTQQAIKQAQNQAENSALWLGNSSAELQMRQLESQLDKAKIDLETKINNDKQTIENFWATTNTLVKNLQLLYEDVITATDKIMWVSPLRQSENDFYERSLWVRNTWTKILAESAVRNGIQQQITINSYIPNLSQSWISSTLQTLKSYTLQLEPILDSLDTMLTFTDSSNSLSQVQLDWFIAQINWLQTQVQWQVSSLTQQINSIESFLNTYEQSQQSVRQSIDGLEKQIASTKESLKSASVNANIWVENALNSYDSTLKNKSTTQASLLNAITQSQIAASEAQTNLGKLTIESPIDWTIGDVLVDVWQEVAPWTPLFTVISTQDQEIEIALTGDEVEGINDWQSVTVTSDWKDYNWTIVSIASSSNATLWYKTIIRLNENIALVWSAATVTIWLKSWQTLIPLKYVKILNKEQWLITIWDGSEIQESIISLWKVRGSSIEISWEIGNNTKIITNDVSNYDPNKFILTPKS